MTVEEAVAAINNAAKLATNVAQNLTDVRNAQRDNAQAAIDLEAKAEGLINDLNNAKQNMADALKNLQSLTGGLK